MSVVSFFEKFLGLQQDKAKATVASYRELVAGIAIGEEPNPAEVERLLAGAGKTVEDLKRDVGHYQRRMELRSFVAALPGLEEECRRVDEQLAAAQSLLDAAEKDYNESTAPLFARRREIQESISDAGNASRELSAPAKTLTYFGSLRKTRRSRGSSKSDFEASSITPATWRIRHSGSMNALIVRPRRMTALASGSSPTATGRTAG